jgi:hypothetical protein
MVPGMGLLLFSIFSSTCDHRRIRAVRTMSSRERAQVLVTGVIAKVESAKEPVRFRSYTNIRQESSCSFSLPSFSAPVLQMTLVRVNHRQ